MHVWQSELCHMGEAVLAVEGAHLMQRAGPVTTTLSTTDKSTTVVN